MTVIGKAWPTASPCKTGGLCEHQTARNGLGSLGVGHRVGAWRTYCPGVHPSKQGLLDASQHLRRPWVLVLQGSSTSKELQAILFSSVVINLFLKTYG